MATTTKLKVIIQKPTHGFVIKYKNKLPSVAVFVFNHFFKKQQFTIKITI